MAEKSMKTIVHYSLKLVSKKDNSEISPDHIRKCFLAISKTVNTSIELDDSANKKFHFLCNLKEHGSNIVYGYFKSAKYDYRPPLIEKGTHEERVSPKKTTEGELEKTHFAIRVDTEDALLLLEQKRSGISITSFVKYINKFIVNVINGYRVEAGLSVSGNFETKLGDLSRAMVVEIYVPHVMVTDSFGNKKISTNDVKNEAKITYSAVKKTSIKDTAKSFFDIMRNKKANYDISRIKIYGKTGSNAQTLLDTDHLKDKSSIKVELDANNQVDSDSMLLALKNAIGGNG
jgi:hypothetical protein